MRLLRSLNRQDTLPLPLSPITMEKAVDIHQLLVELTLDEKLSLLSGASQWRTAAVPRLGIPSLKVLTSPMYKRLRLPSAKTVLRRYLMALRVQGERFLERGSPLRSSPAACH